MTSTERVKDFTAYEEQPYAGMIVPEMFNDDNDDGSGFPGLQRAMFNRMTWWLHSGNMDSGLNVAGYDITGVDKMIAEIVTGEYISGNLVSGTRGYFSTDLTGTTTLITTANITNANITNAISNINFGSTYHLKGVSQISGLIISGQQITGTSGLYGDAIITKNNVTYFTGVRGNFTTDITGAKGYFNSLTGASITGQISGAIILTDILNANSKVIDNLGAPTVDDHAARREDVAIGITTTTIVHANDTERTVGVNPYTKLKEIIFYDNIKSFTVAWQMKTSLITYTATSKIYINDVAWGTEKTTTDMNWVDLSETMTGIYYGDKIQIYAHTSPSELGAAYIANMKIKYDTFVNNDP